MKILIQFYYAYNDKTNILCYATQTIFLKLSFHKGWYENNCLISKKLFFLYKVINEWFIKYLNV